jgi:hypothetical protein
VAGISILRNGSLSTREIALISVFSAIWIGAEMTLGPIVGRFTLGPLTMHGSVNRVLGWFLMLLLAKLTGRFGRVSVMSLVASLGTRVTRLAAVEGIIVGAGYILGGFVFDALYFTLSRARATDPKKAELLVISIMSGTSAILPYLLLKLSVLGIAGFLIFSPQYFYSALKGTMFSIIGVFGGVAAWKAGSLEKFCWHSSER